VLSAGFRIPRTAAVFVALASGLAAQAQKPAMQIAHGQTAALGDAFLKQYCVTCHDSRLKTGGLSLDAIDLRDAAATPSYSKRSS
jgi:mono/diheme cytochrome c family protein